MQTTVFKSGNSLAVRIPAQMAENVGLDNGTAIEIFVEDGDIRIRRSKKYTLESLLALVKPENRHEEVFSDGPKGNEIW
ncbi:AbrB/MazE/SpoVT family DNA-binding domain-containing protein [Effusibacillus lacus]|uniref:Multidrug transporter MatE n=1 Tax=Effusibacillus lacus TaxID=1348429 RepID=A0A292YP13_9BACL|nr:AbrB/MazE/SpoVT family DNA-binding domain-containing protein [Effusibacillus lacus]TCS72508.1 antitoxin MazE [Effusibacillus lacus]GAX90926.1 multidrug transporter MatE [Effusibacillus lacus]